MSEPIKIFVTDDHPVVREGLIAVLETQPDLRVVGEAADGQEAIEKIPASDADIILLDLAMPHKDGVEVIQHLKQVENPARVIVFTIFDSDERIIKSIQAGAKGYLLKGASRQEIFHAIRIVYQGGSLLQPAVASKLVQHISQASETLSPREMEVLKLLSKGMKNKEIARSLFISERTVKFHVSAILAKLGVNNRTEAVQVAVKRGIIDLV